MVAYTGGEIKQGFTNLPIVVDLAGMNTQRKPKLPILLDHKGTQPVGHSTKIENSLRELHVEGDISAATSYSEQVVKATSNGFPFEASIGARATRYDQIRAGKKVTVNGR